MRTDDDHVGPAIFRRFDDLVVCCSLRQKTLCLYSSLLKLAHYLLHRTLGILPGRFFHFQVWLGASEIFAAGAILPDGLDHVDYQELGAIFLAKLTASSNARADAFE